MQQIQHLEDLIKSAQVRILSNISEINYLLEDNVKWFTKLSNLVNLKLKKESSNGKDG